MPNPAEQLLYPDRLHAKVEVLSTPSPVPRAAGVYAWYFGGPLPGVPLSGTHAVGGNRLLYVGISPSAPPTNGKGPSRQTLWHRIRYHYRGNAEGSTLRLTLGCLLARELGTELRRVGNGRRMTFAEGELALSNWMGDHARVAWVEHSTPWELEAQLLQELVLPLNFQENHHCPFHPTLTQLRAAARERARALPVAAGIGTSPP